MICPTLSAHRAQFGDEFRVDLSWPGIVTVLMSPLPRQSGAGNTQVAGKESLALGLIVLPGNLFG
jgi:hypothetical protein